MRYWLGMGTAGKDIIDRSTNQSCSPELIGNLTLLSPAIDSLGMEMWQLSSSGGKPTFELTTTGTSPDPGLFACMAQIKQKFPRINIGICGSANQMGVDAAAADLDFFKKGLREFISMMGPMNTINEIWTDWELKSLSSSQTAGANAAHVAMQSILPTFRYAGCEPRDPPYFSENCSAFVTAAPGVIVQAANTYWSTAKAGQGWYKGFDNLFAQEIANIGQDHIDALSPAICPDCATGADSDDSLSVRELYERMDSVCKAGVTDFSVFTFFELIERRVGGGRGIGARYFDSLAYFRTGKKGTVMTALDSTSGPCDIFAQGGTPCVAAHSVTRAMFASYEGPLYSLSRQSDGAVHVVHTLTQGGPADALSQDQFCASTSCTIELIYDQSANGNHLRTNVKGGLAPRDGLKGVNASRARARVMGHDVYGAFFEAGMGYRNDSAVGTATGTQAESIYFVVSAKHYNDRCCFDYGNAERDHRDDGTGSMEAVYFGNASGGSMNHGGLGRGPWVMADLEKGLWSSNVTTKTESSIRGSSVVMAMLKGGDTNRFAIKAGDASTQGVLHTVWDGEYPSGAKLPGGGHYFPMHKQGAIILGVGGDNSPNGVGTFFEGAMVRGFSESQVDEAVHANIVAAQYEM